MTIKILAIDTATENCSVALLMGDKLYVRSEVAPRDHTKKVLPMVDEVLREADITLGELDALAFGRGPGSFTGVRIGIGIAQGLAFGANLPMIGISTLAAMAQGSYRIHGHTHVASAIDARMEEVYWGRFSRQDDGRWSQVDAECVIAPTRLVELVSTDDHTWACVGTGWNAYQDKLAGLLLQCEMSSVVYPEAQDIAWLARYEFQLGNIVAVEDSAPIYLRDTVAWKKLPGRE
jgi:tRNA threonylcarbamoyladenosine biosynthesis protein TsaB